MTHDLDQYFAVTPPIVRQRSTSHGPSMRLKRGSKEDIRRIRTLRGSTLCDVLRCCCCCCCYGTNAIYLFLWERFSFRHDNEESDDTQIGAAGSVGGAAPNMSRYSG